MRLYSKNPEACSVCGGLTYIIKNLKCPPCEGTGKPLTFRCGYCRGSKQCTQCKGTKVLDPIIFGLSKEIPCDSCKGTGACRHCNGTGLPKCHICAGTGFSLFGKECGFCNKGFEKFECEYCKGTGTQTTSCYKCNGTGTQKTKQEIEDEEQTKRSEINAILRKEAKLLNLDNFKVTLLFKRVGEKEPEEEGAVDYDQFPWAFPVAGQEKDIPSYYGDIEKGTRITLIDAITNSRSMLRQSFLDLDLDIDSNSAYKFYSSNVLVFKDEIEIGSIVIGEPGRFFYYETDFITFLKWIVLTGRFGAVKHYKNKDLNENTFIQMATKIRNQVNYGQDSLDSWVRLMKVLDGSDNADYSVLNDVRLMAFRKFKNISVDPFVFGF